VDNRMVLQESFDIRLKRINYLKQLQLYINENRPANLICIRVGTYLFQKGNVL
jgi:hypothetical protein